MHEPGPQNVRLENQALSRSDHNPSNTMSEKSPIFDNSHENKTIKDISDEFVGILSCKLPGGKELFDASFGPQNVLENQALTRSDYNPSNSMSGKSLIFDNSPENKTIQTIYGGPKSVLNEEFVSILSCKSPGGKELFDENFVVDNIVEISEDRNIDRNILQSIKLDNISNME